MPMLNGSSRSFSSVLLSSASFSPMAAAATSDWRHAVAGSLSVPNSAITPSPMNLSRCPPAFSTASPMEAK